MPLLRSFRLSTYLTLALAALVLGYAEGDLLPEAPYITALVIVLIAVAHRVEGRWSLSLHSANSVGAVLAVAVMAWVGFQFVRGSTGVLDLLPFPANLLPYLGPVLLILIPAKLFRPKHIGDFWAIHGVGLLAVTLGCAMANDFFFGALLVGYVFCFSWSLALFFLYRELQLESEPWASEGPATPRGILRAAGVWTLAIVSVGLLLFLMTPRSVERKWELAMAARGGRIETGLMEGTSIDLNRTGSLETNTEIAFHVYADDAEGNPKLDLDPGMHWRAASLSRYENGRWLRERNSGLNILERTSNHRVRSNSEQDNDRRLLRNARLPDLGPGAYYLSYTLQRSAGSVNICADPVIWRPREAPPIYVFHTRSGAVQQHQDGEFEWLSVPGSGREGYCQVTVSSAEPNLGSPMRVTSSYEDFLTWIPAADMKERVRLWTRGILEKLVRTGQLAPEALTVDADYRLPLEKHHKAIARALEAYLARSGEFIYTVELVRKDKNIDPVEDFLFTTKAGHCQRFASALAIMLRSLGIPAQVVIGFHGSESLGEGQYVVRQSHAHAWVEALVPTAEAQLPRAVEPADGGAVGKSMQWLTLDPTPSEEGTVSANLNFVGWLGLSFAWGEAFVRNLIFGNDASIRERTVEAIFNGWDDFLAALLNDRINGAKLAVVMLTLAVIGPLAVRRIRQRKRTENAARRVVMPISFHARLLDVLARAGYSPLLGQTAREFALKVTDELQKRNLSDAEAPMLLTDAYYRVRFGGLALALEERQALEAALDRLEISLAGASRS